MLSVRRLLAFKPSKKEVYIPATVTGDSEAVAEGGKVHRRGGKREKREKREDGKYARRSHDGEKFVEILKSCRDIENNRLENDRMR